MRGFIFAAVIAAISTGANASLFLDAYAAAQAASEKCENAWFSWSRKSALADFDQHHTRMGMLMGLNMSQVEKMKWANEAFIRCIKLSHPNVDTSDIDPQ